MSAGAPVRFEALGHTYAGPPQVEALASVDAEIPAGQCCAIVGPSGCGKSTLLLATAGLVVPSRGLVTVDGFDVRGRPGHVAFQPQRDLLMPWRRVVTNATLGAEVAGVPRPEARGRALELLERFGLVGFERAWPSSLSGGMRQRVALLRTFLVPRPVLLLDEPFGALDAITRRDMQSWLQDVWAEDGRTVLLVTHDVDEALFLADRVLVMSGRPGRIVCDLPVQVRRPRTASDLTEPVLVGLKREILAALAS